jgi:predicted RNase H-like HicB family nuclease
LERKIREAIEFHIEGMQLHSETMPEPTIRAGNVNVAVE